jgi:hypothetical protein
LAEVGLLPIAARPLALLDDRVERSLGRHLVGHGDELGPPEIGARRLCARRPDDRGRRSAPLLHAVERRVPFLP